MNLFQTNNNPTVDLQEVKKKLLNAEIFACDLETTGFSLDDDRVTIVALACENEQGEVEGWAVDTSEYSLETIREELYDVFHDKEKTAVFHNCFHYQTKVLLEDGSSKMIGEIVNKELDVKVMSWDGKKFVAKKIINYWKNGRRDNWYRLRTKNKPKQSLMYVTGDHKIYTENGVKKRVEELTVGDEILLNEFKLSPSQQQLILGSFLGDGSICKTNSSNGAYFTVGHCEKHKQYTKWKHNALSQFITRDVWEDINNRGYSSSDGKLFKLATYNSLQFLEMKNLAHDGEKKVITRELLEVLDERGLAVLYMDDGSYSGGQPKKTQNTGTACLNLYSFSKEEIDLFRDWLAQKYGIKSGTTKVINDGVFKGYRILMSGDGGRRFCELVAPYIIPTFEYKLPLKYRGQYISWVKNSIELLKVEITELTLLDKTNWPRVLKDNRVGYDLEVEDTHCYFAGNILVSNCNFDIKFLNKYDIFVENKLADTMVMAWLYDEDRVRHRGYGLKHCVLKHLNYRMSSYDEARSLFGGFEEYAADDAVQTLRLYRFFENELLKQNLMDWFWKAEMPIAKILIEVETRGVSLDKTQLKKLKKEAWQTLEAIEKDIYSSVGYKFDVGSPKQWAAVLFDELKIGMRSDGTNEFSHRGKSGEWSTSNAVLEGIKRAGATCKLEKHDKCGHEIAQKLLKFREINTRQNVFIKPLLERCRVSNIIHPKFIQVGTVSGRFASKDPNYQNLPRKGGIRAAFVARPGHKIVKADYSQAELRLMAHMSGDPIMIDIYRSGGDIHQATADACQISRQAAKAVNFGLIYRMSAARLQAQLALQGIEIPIEEAYKYVKRYFKNYKKVREYHKRVEKVVMRRLDDNGEFGWVKTLGGRFRRLDRNYLTMKETAYTAVTQAINSTIQGGVSDLIKLAMVDCQNAFRKNGWLDPENGIWDACIQGQVHDEVFVECKEELAEKVAKIITYCMENAGRKYNIKVPMNADAEIVDSLAKS